MKLFVASILILILWDVYKSDIPVHCLKSQIQGKWVFHATTPEIKTMENLYKMTCGHTNPSKEANAYRTTMDKTLFTQTFTVDLNHDSSATFTDETSTKSGKWTMVYDEGFDFSFGDVGTTQYSTYFVFSKYGTNEKKSGPMKSNWLSYCYGTLIGWYQVGNSYGCFYGAKKDFSEDTITNGEVSNKQNVVEGSLNGKAFIQVDDSRISSRNNLLKPSREIRFMESRFSDQISLTANFKDHNKVVERINSSNLSWKAVAYSEFEGKTIEELNKIAGRTKTLNLHFKDDPILEPLNTATIRKKKNGISKSRLNSKNSNKNPILSPVPSPLTSSSPSPSPKINTNSELPINFDWTRYMGKPKSQVFVFLILG